MDYTSGRDYGDEHGRKSRSIMICDECHCPVGACVDADDGGGYYCRICETLVKGMLVYVEDYNKGKIREVVFAPEEPRGNFGEPVDFWEKLPLSEQERIRRELLKPIKGK